MRHARWPAAWLTLAVMIACAAIWWPHIRNEFFVLLGSRNEAGGWYGFHSGFGGTPLFSAAVLFAPWYWHHTCHDSAWCLRWGKYPAAGGVFRLCRFHHPDLLAVRPHRDLIHRLHREHKQARG